MTGSTAPTALSPWRTRPSIAPRTKGATWSGNERAPLPQVWIRVQRHGGALLPERRQHARGDPGEKASRGALVRQRNRRAHAAPPRQIRTRPRLDPVQPDSRRALSGDEEAGRGRDVVRLSRLGDQFGRDRGDQGALPAPRLRQELGRAPAPLSGTGDAPRPPLRLPNPAPRRIRGRADLPGDAVPQG